MKKHTVSIAVAVFVGLLLLATVIKRLLTSTYSVSVTEQISQLSTSEAKFSLLDYALALKANDPNILLIDVRSEEEYRLGHLPNAINIPLNKLFLQENADFIAKGKYLTKVLYGNDEAQAVRAQSLFIMRGIDGFIVLNGGFQMAQRYVVEEPSPSYYHFADERKRHNYERLMPAGGSEIIKGQKEDVKVEVVAPRGGC